MSPAEDPMTAAAARWLICFAVKEEKAFFPLHPDCSSGVIVTGMGARNASQAVQRFLSRQPRLTAVITAGFAGGLNPTLQRGTVIYDLDETFPWASAISASGAVRGTFHCAARVAVTVADKAALRRNTGADAVEMESSVIRSACREAGVPSATIRVISDAADEDLPLDFDALMTEAHDIHWPRLAWTLIKRPGLIPRLMRFQRQTSAAAKSLGETLTAIVKAAA